MSAITQGTATATTQIENDRVRVTEWRFRKRGDNTGWHRHDHDYVVVPFFDGALDIDTGNGERTTATMKCGASYFRKAGVEHDVISANEFECAFVEIEILDPASKVIDA